MIEILQLQANVMSLISLALLAVGIFSFVNSLLWSAEAYEAAGKLTKPAWTIILGVGVAVQAFFGFGLLGVAAIIAAFVYLADVRPALGSLRRR